MKTTITNVIPTAEAQAKFAESVASQNEGHLPVFLFLVDKILREYKQFDYQTFLYHSKPYETPNEELAHLFDLWTEKMIQLNKLTRIPSLVYDFDSFVLIG